jgi:signal transduction histidine kinase
VERAVKDQIEYSMATSPATPWHRRLAFAVIVVSLVAFGAVAPFATIPLPRLDSFIPTVMAIVFVTDLVTAVLLFGQFSTTGSRALLVLASGYLFSSLIAIPFTLTFPGAFAPTGLLGAGSQSAAWLNVSFRFGFSVATVGYALLTSGEHTKGSIESSPRRAIFWSVTIVIIVVCALTSAVTAGHDLMPHLLGGTAILPLGHYVNGMIVLTNVLVLLLLWSRGKSVLDLWLMVAVCALIMETGLVAGFVSSRFSIGFYATRLIPLVVSKVVLIVLLSETLILSERLASAFISQRHERENRLMSVEAATAAMAHELRQPLTAIASRGTAGLNWLKRTPPELNRASECLGSIVDATHRGLFRDAPTQRAMIQINDICSEVLNLVQDDLRVEAITATAEYQENLPPIHAAHTQIQQVILNLVKNAIEAMRSGSSGNRRLRLVTGFDEKSSVSVYIQDSGGGIAPQYRDRIFDPFFTTKPLGTGLGLFICRVIAEEHGGELRLSKTDSHGTSFELILPVGSASHNRTAARIAPSNV